MQLRCLKLSNMLPNKFFYIGRWTVTQFQIKLCIQITHHLEFDSDKKVTTNHLRQ